MSMSMGGQSTGSQSGGEAGFEPVVASGGGVSFDELDTVMEQSSASEKSAKEPTEEAPKKGAKAKEIEPDPSEADKEESEKEEKLDGKKDEKSKEKDAEKDKDSKDLKKQKPDKAKAIKLKVGDKEIELPTDTPIEVTVDGKVEQVSLQDLRNNYSGKVAYEKKFSELDRERKSFQTERVNLQNSVNSLYELAVTKNDPEGAIKHLAQAMGGNVHQVLKNFREAYWAQFDKLKDLTPEERQAAEKDWELEHLRRQESERTEQDAQRKVRETVESRVKAVQEAHNLTEEGFYKAYEALKASGMIDPKDITPEKVGEFHVELKSTEDLEKVLDEVAPGLETREAALVDLTKVMKANGFTAEDMRDIIAEVYGKKGAKSLAKKLKQGTAAGERKAAAPVANRDPLSFDDIE